MALVRGRLLRRGGAIAGIVLGAVALVLSIVLSVVYTFLFVLASAGSFGATASGLPSPRVSSLASATASAGQRTVTFTVSGSGKATLISYTVADQSGAGTDQVQKVKLPWSKTVPLKPNAGAVPTVYQLTAERGDSDGKVTCTVEVGGKVVSEHHSSGAYATTSCSGQIG